MWRLEEEERVRQHLPLLWIFALYQRGGLGSDVSQCMYILTSLIPHCGLCPRQAGRQGPGSLAHHKHKTQSCHGAARPPNPKQEIGKQEITLGRGSPVGVTTSEGEKYQTSKRCI